MPLALSLLRIRVYRISNLRVYKGTDGMIGWCIIASQSCLSTSQQYQSSDEYITCVNSNYQNSWRWLLYLLVAWIAQYCAIRGLNFSKFCIFWAFVPFLTKIAPLHAPRFPLSNEPRASKKDQQTAKIQPHKCAPSPIFWAERSEASRFNALNTFNVSWCWCCKQQLLTSLPWEPCHRFLVAMRGSAWVYRVYRYQC